MNKVTASCTVGMIAAVLSTVMAIPFIAFSIMPSDGSDRHINYGEFIVTIITFAGYVFLPALVPGIILEIIDLMPLSQGKGYLVNGSIFSISLVLCYFITESWPIISLAVIYPLVLGASFYYLFKFILLKKI